MFLLGFPAFLYCGWGGRDPQLRALWRVGLAGPGEGGYQASGSDPAAVVLEFDRD